MGTLHFRESEFLCKCCSTGKYSPHLVAVLELVRIHFNKPVFINSSYRCPTHNSNEGGADKSKHLEGIAADIEVSDVDAKEVYTFLNKVFPNSYGLGSYTGFTHIDVRNEKARW